MLDNHPHLLPYLFSSLLIIISNTILLSLFSHHLGEFSTQAHLIILISSSLVCGFLFYPEQTTEPATITISCCVMLASVTIISALLDQQLRQHISLCLISGYIVFSISLLLKALIRTINQLFKFYPQTPLLLIFFSALMTTLPIWISPWIEMTAYSQTTLDLVLSSSPLTYMANMLDYDLLHSQWFYQHTPYGMYRFDYPDKLLFNLGLLTCALLMLFYSPKNSSR